MSIYVDMIWIPDYLHLLYPHIHILILKSIYSYIHIGKPLVGSLLYLFDTRWIRNVSRMDSHARVSGYPSISLYLSPPF